MILRNPSTGSARHQNLLLMLVVLGMTSVVYFPGLSGQYIFDDFWILVENPRVHVDSLDPEQWISAVQSYGTDHQSRALTMLSFALNHYFTGLDPYWMKFTNLLIHLLNGVLLFLVLQALFGLWRTSIPSASRVSPASITWASLTLCSAWLLLPVNLTAVLYVAQRMESLSNTFVLLGLCIYLASRTRHWQGEGGYLGMICGLVLCTVAGMLVKESAVLLPLYAACIEGSITRFCTAGGERSRGLVWLYIILLAVPAIIGMVWFLTWVGGPTTYPRPFTLVERLMTEARVLVIYVMWVLVPLLDNLSLYHDDIVISRGLFDPPTTAGAIVCLVGLLLLGLKQIRLRPLFALGVFWFFAGHAVTATVIPLELVFEHRNYFPSIGLLLAFVSILLLEPGIKFFFMRRVVALLVVVFFATQTTLAAREWSDPQRLSVAFVKKNPDSLLSQHEFARALFRKAEDSSGDVKNQLYKTIERTLETASGLNPHIITSEAMLIILAGHIDRSVEERWWYSIKKKLAGTKALYPNIQSLGKLARCQLTGACSEQLEHLADAFMVASNQPDSPPALWVVYARFAAHNLNDPQLAERSYRKALEIVPGNSDVRKELVSYLVQQGDLESVIPDLKLLDSEKKLGFVSGTIEKLKKAVKSSGSGRTAYSD